MAYYPYLRGRQYELFALRELLSLNALSPSVVPIVEPVKDNDLLKQVIRQFVDGGRKIAVVMNPGVGYFADVGGRLDEKLDIYGEEVLEYDALGRGSLVIPTLLPDPVGVDIASRIRKKAENMGCDFNFMGFISEEERGSVRLLQEINAKYVASPDTRGMERDLKRNHISSDRITFSDPFNKRKNVEYADGENVDEFFSDEHKYYMEDNFIGYGDYSIVGDNYDERGGAPRAVAIHIMYLDGEDALRIHHFVSEETSDPHEIPSLFVQAAKKIEPWCLEHGWQESLQTYGLKTLIGHAESETFPGLPTIKKLSIMHHLELIGKFLDRPEGSV